MTLRDSDAPQWARIVVGVELAVGVAIIAIFFGAIVAWFGAILSEDVLGLDLHVVAEFTLGAAVLLVSGGVFVIHIAAHEEVKSGQ